MSTGRLEAFSDGVIAVAITLLVLNIDVPKLGPHETLAHGLAEQWPVYAAYATSFMTIGIIWINHHVMISRLREADHTLLFFNLLLLLSIGILPFATSLMAAYLKQSEGQHLAAAIYSGSFLFMSLCFANLNRCILLGKPQMMGRQLPLKERRLILARSISGVVPYVIATAVAILSPYATIAICAGIGVFYALPIASRTGQQA